MDTDWRQSWGQKANNNDNTLRATAAADDDDAVIIVIVCCVIIVTFGTGTGCGTVVLFHNYEPCVCVSKYVCVGEKAKEKERPTNPIRGPNTTKTT